MTSKKLNLSIDVGGTNIRAALLRGSDIVGSVFEAKTPKDLHEFKQVFASIIDKFANNSSIGQIGIGLPGAVDLSQSKIIFCPNLPFLNNKKADELIKSKYPVKIGNDVDLAMIAEIKHNGLEKDAVLLLNIGTGLGAAYYLNGCYSWQLPFAAEVGHMKVIKNGRPCHCGGEGCLEAYFSGWGLLEQAREIDQTIFCVEEVFERSQNNSQIKQLIEDNIEILAIGIANAVNLLGVNIVILGGQLSYSLPGFINHLKTKIDQNIYGSRDVILNKSSLINRSTLIGASLF